MTYRLFLCEQGNVLFLFLFLFSFSGLTCLLHLDRELAIDFHRHLSVAVQRKRSVIMSSQLSVRKCSAGHSFFLEHLLHHQNKGLGGKKKKDQHPSIANNFKLKPSFGGKTSILLFNPASAWLASATGKNDGDPFSSRHVFFFFFFTGKNSAVIETANTSQPLAQLSCFRGGFKACHKTSCIVNRAASMADW